MAYAVLAYATTLYAVMAYTMTSLIQIQPVWRQRSEGEDPEALSSPLCAAPVDLLDPPHLKVLHGVARLSKVGCNCFFCFPCSYVGAVSVHPHV